ncbi:proton-coupled folate transporter-like [Actinia tenebrosa]|uniref:Proton-coupled folate transporter-like n=1 Tax=Actinia tenebrosa TaxID=6105 RepID=A0A6P8HGM3_ACTTE|nr:proton-coupled folate transporter-like [Actinia tenebrosa]
MKISRLTWKTFLTVEPVLFLCACAFFMNIPLQKQFIYSKFSQKVGFPYSLQKDEIHGEMNAVKNDTMKKLENEVQTLSSNFDSLNVPSQLLPSLIMGLFIGPWTDIGGRKPAILASVTGAIIEALFVIGVVYFELSLYLILVGKLFNGLSGFFGSLTQASFSYISDTTETSLVSTRLAILQLVIFTGGFLGQAFSGIIMSRFGFLSPCLIILVLSLAAFSYSLYSVPESLPRTDHSHSLFTTGSFTRLIQVFTNSRPSSQRWNLLVLVLLNTIYFIVAMGTRSVNILYLMRSPISLSPTLLGAYTALRFLMEGLGGIIGVVVLKKYLKEENVIRVGFLSLGLSMTWLGFVANKEQAFTVPVVGSICGILMPTIKGMAANIVTIQEKGSMFTAITGIEGLSMIIGSLLCNTMYVYFSSTGKPGLVFVFFGTLSLLSIFIVSILQKPKEE